MPKFKSTQDILRIIGNKDQIRNFGVIAHVDHGKTTMSDSLLAASGIISPSVAGQALALDSMKLEQNRQMTIRGANVTLFYETDGKEYVINMIDTPGHIDFTGRVTRALRAIDGAVVVSDSVEGIMTQTETVTRQALEERVRPVLYINKIDRLVKELKLDAAAMQKWLANIISHFNQLIDIYAEPEIKEKWKVSIESNTVAFGSAKDRWGFNFNMYKKTGIGFKQVYEAYTSNDPAAIKALSEKSPLHDAVCDDVQHFSGLPLGLGPAATGVIPSHLVRSRQGHAGHASRIDPRWLGDVNPVHGMSLRTMTDAGRNPSRIKSIDISPNDAANAAKNAGDNRWRRPGCSDTPDNTVETIAPGTGSVAGISVRNHAARPTMPILEGTWSAGRQPAVARASMPVLCFQALCHALVLWNRSAAAGRTSLT